MANPIHQLTINDGPEDDPLLPLQQVADLSALIVYKLNSYNSLINLRQNTLLPGYKEKYEGHMSTLCDWLRDRQHFRLGWAHAKVIHGGNYEVFVRVPKFKALFESVDKIQEMVGICCHHFDVLKESKVGNGSREAYADWQNGLRDLMALYEQWKDLGTDPNACAREFPKSGSLEKTTSVYSSLAGWFTRSPRR